MKGTFPIDKFQEIQTPFYYYDTNVLRQTLKTINAEAGKHEGFEVHYAVKANANPKVLNIICQAGLGADCVSGGVKMIQKCLGFLRIRVISPFDHRPGFPDSFCHAIDMPMIHPCHCRYNFPISHTRLLLLHDLIFPMKKAGIHHFENDVFQLLLVI